MVRACCPVCSNVSTGALENEVVSKKEANELLDSGGGAILVSLVQQSEMTLKNFPRQRCAQHHGANTMAQWRHAMPSAASCLILSCLVLSPAGMTTWSDTSRTEPHCCVSHILDRSTDCVAVLCCVCVRCVCVHACGVCDFCRIYKRGFIAMEPSVRALRDEIDPELGEKTVFFPTFYTKHD